MWILEKPNRSGCFYSCRVELSEIKWEVTMLFGCSEREYHNGDEIAWYADGDKIVRNEYNPAIAYVFGILISNFIFFMWFF